jgi:undecaprenyl-diphosphatase
MEWFDLWVVHFLNQFSQSSPLFDSLVVYVAKSHLFKGGIMIALFWWAWFRYDGNLDNEARERILSTLLFAIVAIVLGRLLARLLPFRVRPMVDSDLVFNLPHGFKPGTLQVLSSFPSDHAIFFFCLATGLYFVHRRLGVVALSYTVIVITFSRVYVGYHYPTDVLVGALIGVGIACVANLRSVRTGVGKFGLNWSATHPALFYAFFFLLSFEIAEMFEGVRFLATGLLRQLSIAPDFLQ